MVFAAKFEMSVTKLKLLRHVFKLICFPKFHRALQTQFHSIPSAPAENVLTSAKSIPNLIADRCDEQITQLSNIYVMQISELSREDGLS